MREPYCRYLYPTSEKGIIAFAKHDTIRQGIKVTLHSNEGDAETEGYPKGVCRDKENDQL